MTRVAAVTPDGRCYSQAIVGPFEVTRLTFPPDYRHGAFEPQRGYLVVVLQGSVCKTFSGDCATLGRGDVATLPAGSTHSSAFAPTETQVLTVRAADESPLFGSLLTRRRHLRASASTALGWRMAIGARGDGRVLVAGARGSRAPTRGDGRAGVVRASRARGSRACGSCCTTARPSTRRSPSSPAAVGRHPTHVARVFRREYGLSVGEYARSLRLEWAASRLALDDAPLAQVALEAGFADQSHFTRAFRRHAGVTPGRYRELRRS